MSMTLIKPQQQLEIDLPLPPARVKIKRRPFSLTNFCECGCGRLTPWNEKYQRYESVIPYPHGPAYDSPPTLPPWSEPNYGINYEDSIERIWNLGRNIHEHFYLIGMELIWLKKVHRRTFGSWVNENLWFSERKARIMMAYARECTKAGKLVETQPRKWRKTAKSADLDLNIYKQRPEFSALCEFPNAFEAEGPMAKIHAIASAWMKENRFNGRQRRAFAIKFNDLAQQLMETTANDFRVTRIEDIDHEPLSFQVGLTTHPTFHSLLKRKSWWDSRYQYILERGPGITDKDLTTPVNPALAALRKVRATPRKVKRRPFIKPG
jgi:hypothetical protein